MKTDQGDLVDLAEIAEIELRILRRMKEYTLGEHGSVFHGAGVDLVGLRDWQAGDRVSSIDWPQSTLTNFTPMVIREFEQPGTAPIVVLADTSPSTRCGTSGVPIAAGIARAIATIGLSAVYFQDMLGMITFDAGFERMGSVRPRVGRAHVIHCLETYQGRVAAEDVKQADDFASTVGGQLRRTALVPVVSDFLFGSVPDLLRDLAELNSVHDVFLILIDSAFAFELPDVSAGWIHAYDVETGQSRLVSRRELGRLAARVRDWQTGVERQAHDADLDVLRLSLETKQSLTALMEFVTVRRLRKAQGDTRR